MHIYQYTRKQGEWKEKSCLSGTDIVVFLQRGWGKLEAEKISSPIESAPPVPAEILKESPRPGSPGSYPLP